MSDDDEIMSESEMTGMSENVEQKSKAYFIPPHFTDSAIHRLAKKAGVKRITSIAVTEVRDRMDHFVKEILKKAVNSMSVHDRKTILSQDIELGLPVKMFSEGLKAKTCKIRPKTTTKKRANQAKNFQKDLKYYQNCDGLSIPIATFKNIVRNMVESITNSDETRLSQNALIILQYATEQYFLEILEKAQELASLSNRVRLQSVDISRVCRITGDPIHMSLPEANVQNLQNFETAMKEINKLLNEQDETKIKLSRDAVSQLNFIVNQLILKLALVAKSMRGDAKTISQKLVAASLRQFLGGMAEYVQDKIEEDMEYSNVEELIKVSKSKIRKIIKDATGLKIGHGVLTYTALAVDSVVIEILRELRKHCEDKKKVKITNEILHKVTEGVDDFKELLHTLNVKIMTTMGTANVLSYLLPEKKN